MTKIININTGLVREVESPKPPNCNICNVEVYEDEGGVEGVIGRLPIAMCGVCVSGIVSILIERNNER